MPLVGGISAGSPPAALVHLAGAHGPPRLDAPLPTLTGGGHHEYLLTPPGGTGDADAPKTPALADCHYRSLTVAELKAGMGFPAAYQLCGPQGVQAALAGQAVCPPTVAALFARCLPILA